MKIKIKTKKEKPSCVPCNTRKPAYQSPPIRTLCDTSDKCNFEEEEECVLETFDMSQVRYRIDCDDVTRYPNKGIERGARLDYVLEDIYNKLQNIDYIENPKVPGNPLITSFQGIISDLYHKIETQGKEIEQLNKRINAL